MPKVEDNIKRNICRIFLLAVLVACLVTSIFFMLSAKADENGYLAYQYTPRLQGKQSGEMVIYLTITFLLERK